MTEEELDRRGVYLTQADRRALRRYKPKKVYLRKYRWQGDDEPWHVEIPELEDARHRNAVCVVVAVLFFGFGVIALNTFLF